MWVESQTAQISMQLHAMRLAGESLAGTTEIRSAEKSAFAQTSGEFDAGNTYCSQAIRRGEATAERSKRRSPI